MPPVVLVDLDDTLIPDVSAAREAISLVLQEFSQPHEVDAVLVAARETWRSNAWRGHREVERVSSWEALWADFSELPEVAEALAGHAVRAWQAACPGVDAEALSRAYVRHRTRLVVPFPGAAAALDGNSSTDMALADAGGWPVVHICGDVPCAGTGRHSVDFAGVPAFCRC